MESFPQTARLSLVKSFELLFTNTKNYFSKRILLLNNKTMSFNPPFDFLSRGQTLC